jgi:hypothetical protein
MRGLLSKAPGVQQQTVTISRDPKDRLNNSVSIVFNPAMTNRDSLIKLVTDIWEIAYYECPCGKTSVTPAECCGKAMKAVR